jgi:hypothetical protein
MPHYIGALRRHQSHDPGARRSLLDALIEVIVNSTARCLCRPRLLLLFALDDGTFEMVGRTHAVYFGNFGILSLKPKVERRACANSATSLQRWLGSGRLELSRTRLGGLT